MQYLFKHTFKLFFGIQVRKTDKFHNNHVIGNPSNKKLTKIIIMSCLDPQANSSNDCWNLWPLCVFHSMFVVQVV
jgi:hypothetical protein